ncbi:hypothetical protein [Cupriavidus sp. D39]|uniref:hypothetical protein n=1 Tax=Cupriavidus sp. D39 TaxID=2997877 RepID=UPI00226FE4D9|nr:hypothetical protein [Cupriavidus sp. D39]MCY0856438.1 hypothetical protein [Cupriavidus sp. D39]
MIQKKKKGLGDRWFNPHRIARLADLSEFVGAIVSEMEKHEAAVMPRTRARRAADQDVFERQAEALLCDALLRNLTKPGEWLTASRSKTVLGRRCRYRSSVMGDKLPMVMDLLDGCGLLEVRLGDVCKYRGASIKQTTFRASKRLLERASHLDLQFSDFGTDGLEEVIVLRSEKVQGKGMLVRYEDTEETIALRSQIAALNVWLSQADIELAQDIPGVNPQDRMMHRVFNNGRFDHGGDWVAGFGSKWGSGRGGTSSLMAWIQ